MAFAPSPTLFHHFIEEAQAQAGSIYGRLARTWDLEEAQGDGPGTVCVFRRGIRTPFSG